MLSKLSYKTPLDQLYLKKIIREKVLILPTFHFYSDAGLEILNTFNLDGSGSFGNTYMITGEFRRRNENKST